jgi:SAM-dependent methyltransferase
VRNWSATPKFILRRDCVQFATRNFPSGSFIEVGAGTGEMTKEFLSRGFSGTCYDIGFENRDITRSNLSEWEGQVDVADSLTSVPEGRFDYLFAFEVLEHIEDDLAALKEWTKHLRSGGVAIVSVPAHSSKFGPTDEAVGHVRRYERDELFVLFHQAGFTDCKVFCYGFPLGNITSIVSDRVYRRTRVSQDDQVERSMLSGIERPRIANSLAPVAKSSIMIPFCWLQRHFFSQDWGDGYVLVGQYGGLAER